MQYSLQHTDTTEVGGFRVECYGYTAAMDAWRQVLVEAWERQRLTLDELADRTGLNRGTIHRILDGTTKDPGLTTVAKMAVALGPAVAQRVASIVFPRPEESGDADVGGGTSSGAGVGADPVIQSIWTAFQEVVDRDDSAPDSLEGDVLKAAAILDRAVQRIGRASAARRQGGQNGT